LREAKFKKGSVPNSQDVDTNADARDPHLAEKKFSPSLKVSVINNKKSAPPVY
jgi:hypothetical protein